MRSLAREESEESPEESDLKKLASVIAVRQPRASAGLCFDSGSRQAEQPGDSGRLGGLVNAPHVMVIQFEFEMSLDVDHHDVSKINDTGAVSF